MSKDPHISTTHTPINAASFPSRRAMVAYRDGKIYVDSPWKVAYFHNRGILPDSRTSDRFGRKGG